VSNKNKLIANGTDVSGEINGEQASGRGQILTGDLELIQLRELRSAIQVKLHLQEEMPEL